MSDIEIQKAIKKTIEAKHCIKLITVPILVAVYILSEVMLWPEMCQQKIN